MLQISELIESAAEICLDKGEPQIWFRQMSGDWIVVFFHEGYKGLAERAPRSLPFYAIEGQVSVSSEGVVQSDFEPNSEYSKDRIEKCPYLKST